MDICRAKAFVSTFLRMGMMQQTTKMIITTTIRTVVPILANTAPHCPNVEANQSHDFPLLPAFSVTSCLGFLSLDIAVVNDGGRCNIVFQICDRLHLSRPESSLMLVGSAKQAYWFHATGLQEL